MGIAEQAIAITRLAGELTGRMQEVLAMIEALEAKRNARKARKPRLRLVIDNTRKGGAS